MAYLPDSLVKQWSGKGKDEALALLQKAYQKSPSLLTANSDFHSLLYDALRRFTNGELDVEDATVFLSDLATSLGHEGLFSELADLLTVLDADVMCSENKEQLSTYRALVRSLREVVGEALLKERLDMDTLEGVGLVPSKASFNQRYVKTKTKLFYKQQKFNLFREESEGYSKLVAELGHERRALDTVPTVLDNIRSLIGRFNLDPNRVLNVLMDACECHYEDKEVFLALLRGYPCEHGTFINVLGFKFQSCQSSDASSSSASPSCPSSSSTSSSLYQLAALLLHEGLVTLTDLYPHLSVSHSTLKDFYETTMEAARTKAKKAMVLSLTEKTEEERQKDVETEKEAMEYRLKLLDLSWNQKLGLLRACIQLGDWSIASSLLSLLPPLLPAWCPGVVQALCQYLHYVLEPLYLCYAPKAAHPSPPSHTPLVSSQCRQFRDLSPTIFRVLSSLGPTLHSDPVLMVKVVRLGRAFFKEHPGCLCRQSGEELPAQDLMDVFHGFVSILDKVIFPSLSLLNCNSAIAEEVWSMVKHLPYERRYELYGRWKNRSYGVYPEMMDVRTQTLTQGRYIMKRLTKENVKPSGRMIGKLSHSNPSVIFEYVLSQIQRYDNFIIPVVDSLKYLTPLAYDVLAYGVIEALGNPQKERLKHEDTNISNWLQGLASFSANVFKKYPIELTGLLQYVANQLKAGKSFDLLVLKEVVQKMSGIEISEDVTQSQLEALAGGGLLKAEGAYFSQVRNTKKSSHRLREALLEADLSLPLCLLMAQQREGIIYREGANRHLKLVCNLYDNCLDSFVQFGGFLSTHLNHDDYNYRVPPLDALGLEYHISADAAFFMLRPLIKSSINEKFLQLEKSSKESGETNKLSKASSQEASYIAAWQEVLDPVVEAARKLHPPKVWEDVSPRLYTTFWSLSLYDLYVPVGRYEEEVRKAKEVIKEVEEKMDLPSSKRKKEQERGLALIEKLQEERVRQEDNHRLVASCIRRDKDTWFTAKVTKNRTITQFLQLCVFPRCRFTATDAIFCAKFMYMLHTQQAPNFSTLLFLDRTFSDVSYSVACCTENEVRRYGRFLGAILEVVSKWHSTEALYEQECARTPGFISMMRSSAGGAEKMQYLDYENYRHITFKWHFKLTKALVVLLESKDYMQVRNGLIVLTKVLPYYPKVYHLSIALEKRVEKIMEEEKEKRADLYALAIGYAGMLKSHKQNLVPEAEFHIREERVKAQKPDDPPARSPSTTEKKGDKEKEEKAQVPPMEEKPPKIPKVKSIPTVGEAAKAANVGATAGKKGEEVLAAAGVAGAGLGGVASPLPLASLPPAGRASDASGGGKTKEEEEQNRSSGKGSKADEKKEGARKEGEKEEGKAVATTPPVAVDVEREKRRSGAREKSGSERDEEKEEKSGKSGGRGSEKSTPGGLGSKSGTPVGGHTTPKGAKTGQSSPLVHQNGPARSSPSPARAGQRRPLADTGTADNGHDKDTKRRKIDEKARTDDLTSKEKEIDKRKRERSLDKEISDPKRRKESPQDDSPSSSSSSSSLADNKRRLVKLSSKKEGYLRVPETSPLTRKNASLKKEKEEKTKKHTSRQVKK